MKRFFSSANETNQHQEKEIGLGHIRFVEEVVKNSSKKEFQSKRF